MLKFKGAEQIVDAWTVKFLKVMQQIEGKQLYLKILLSPFDKMLFKKQGLLTVNSSVENSSFRIGGAPLKMWHLLSLKLLFIIATICIKLSSVC